MRHSSIWPGRSTLSPSCTLFVAVCPVILARSVAITNISRSYESWLAQCLPLNEHLYFSSCCMNLRLYEKRCTRVQTCRVSHTPVRSIHIHKSQQSGKESWTPNWQLALSWKPNAKSWDKTCLQFVAIILKWKTDSPEKKKRLTPTRLPASLGSRNILPDFALGFQLRTNNQSQVFESNYLLEL